MLSFSLPITGERDARTLPFCATFAYRGLRLPLLRAVWLDAPVGDVLQFFPLWTARLS